MANGGHGFDEQEILGMLLHEIRGCGNAPVVLAGFAMRKLPPDCELRNKYETLYKEALDARRETEGREGAPAMLKFTKLCSTIVLDEAFNTSLNDEGGLEYLPKENIENDKMFASILLVLIDSYEKGDLFGLTSKGKVDTKAILNGLRNYFNIGNSIPDVDLYLPEEDAYITGSALAIWVLVDNLLRNAKSALTDAYKDTKSYPRVIVSLKIVDGQVVIEVIDKGTGIKEEDLPRIFDIYFTTKGEAGTGLGLAICKFIAENHSGTISVASRHFSEYPDDHGTTFTIRLPVAVDAAALAAGATSGARSDIPSGKSLLEAAREGAPGFVQADLAPVKAGIEHDL